MIWKSSLRNSLRPLLHDDLLRGLSWPVYHWLPCPFFLLFCHLPSVQFSHSFLANSLQPDGLKHARLPYPSPAPGACSHSYPLSLWCYPIISSSDVPSPPAFNLPSIRVFSNVSVLRIAKVLELQPESSQWIFRFYFLQDGLVRSPFSPRHSQESSPTPQFKSINSSAVSFSCYLNANSTPSDSSKD